jgi:hypothetical protein
MRLRAGAGVTILLVLVAGCRDTNGKGSDSARGTLPPVYPSSPLESTNWDREAGPVLIVSRGTGSDSVAVVLPEATDSTIVSFQGMTPPVAGLRFDLFSRSGKVGSAIPISLLRADSARRQCNGWPAGTLQSGADWKVGLTTGSAVSVALDSIEKKSSADSAALAASLAQMTAVLPVASDPTFRGLPFRVRSAYTFHIDTTEMVIADVVRTVNEEASPRVEHFFIIGERPIATGGKFSADYYSRAAGSEDSVQATDVLAVLQIGPEKRPAIVVTVEYANGGKLALVERTAVGKWSATWTSAYTDC